MGISLRKDELDLAFRAMRTRFGEPNDARNPVWMTPYGYVGITKNSIGGHIACSDEVLDEVKAALKRERESENLKFFTSFEAWWDSQSLSAESKPYFFECWTYATLLESKRTSGREMDEPGT